MLWSNGFGKESFSEETFGEKCFGAQQIRGSKSNSKLRDYIHLQENTEGQLIQSVISNLR